MHWAAQTLSSLLFGTLAASSFTLTFGRILKTGINLDAHCKQFPFYITSYPSFDSFLNAAFCPLAEFFNVLFKLPQGLKYSVYASHMTLPLILILNFEAYRFGQSRFLKYPFVWLLVTQWYTIGAVLPLYWMVSILTGGPSLYRKRDATSFTQAEAEALVFGIIAGVVIPTTVLVKKYDPVVLAIWMLYPAIMALAESTHLYFRPPSQHPKSGIVTLRVLFVACFILASSFHISTIWPLFKDLGQMKELIFPSLVPLPSTESDTLHYFDFIKWDLLFGHCSTVLATFWFSENLNQVIAIALWYICSIPFIGTGAALAGFAIWRYGLL